MNMFLSLEHINPDLVDIPVEVDLEVYHGSTEGFTSDDPSEIDILKVTVLEEIKYKENGIDYTIYKGDVIHQIDSKMKDQIYEEYATQNQ